MRLKFNGNSVIIALATECPLKARGKGGLELKHPKLDKIEDKLLTGNDFVLSRAQYIRLTGIDIPEDKSYTEKRSAVARKAKAYGYVITVIPEKLEFRRISNAQ